MHAFVGADVDRRSQRVDIVTGQLIDYQPPQPSSDHEWNATNKRWHLTQAVQAKQAARSTALAKIAALEASGVRCARELALGQAGPVGKVQAPPHRKTGAR